ncbi:MAG: hypothetical protein WBF90_04520 [Rivularia sp. (in: cyanobacteria)]
MKNRNSVNQDRFTPDEIIQIYSIKKSTYYERLKFLGIKAQKDEEGKAYLDLEQAELLKKLGEHIKATGKMEGFEFGEAEDEQLETGDDSGGQLAVKESGNGLVTSDNDNWAPKPDSIIEQQIPETQPNYSEEMNGIFRQAAEIKAQGMAMPNLVALQLAGQMTFDDLPDDLKGKVTAVQEAANPKMQPANIASQLLAQYRANRK